MNSIVNWLNELSQWPGDDCPEILGKGAMPRVQVICAAELAHRDARIAELEAELKRAKQDACWHCGDVLEASPPPRCERCPVFGECDDGGCREMGCAEEVGDV